MAVGQVETPHPSEGAVSVIFPQLGMLTAIRVQISAENASANTGDFALPQRGDWGLITFHQNDPRSARWTATLQDAFTNAAPLELFTDDPDLRASFERTGRDRYRHGNGDLETQHPDSSLWRVTHGSGDPAKVTQRMVGIVEGEARTRRRVKPKRKTADRLQLYFKQSDRLLFHLDDEGNVRINLTVPDEPDPKLRYEVKAQKDGTVSVQNRAETKLELLPSGEAAVTLKNGAELRLNADGSIQAKPAPGKPLLLGAGADHRPVIRAGDLATPPGTPLVATTATVLASS